MASDRNILLLTIDSLRADVVFGEAGHIAASSDFPSLATFAGGAAAFTRAYAQGPYTSCAMSSLFTGRYPRFAIVPRRTVRPGCPTMAERLQRGGYTTAGFHSNPLISAAFGYGRGFDYLSESLLPGRLERLQGLLPWRVSHRFSKGLRAVTRRPYLDAAGINRKAIELLAGLDAPWFTWIHYMDVHGPYQPHANGRFLDKWRAERLWHRSLTQPEGITDDQLHFLLSGYRDEIIYWDRQFAKLMEALVRLGVADSTVIVVTADHGDEFREHGEFAHVRKLYEELVRVPLFISIPGQEGRRVDELVGHIDVLPTILELAGIVSEGQELDGRSLMPLVKGERPSWSGQRCLLADATPDRTGARVSARRGGWKYIMDEIEGSERLFDLEADPDELSNVISHPDTAVLDSLRACVESYLREARRRAEEGADVGAVEEAAGVDEEVIRRLEALGYVEDAEQLRS